jgi:uncharacterized protein
MKIWSDSLLYLNSIRNGHTNRVELIPNDDCAPDDCSGDCPTGDCVSPYYDTECGPPLPSGDCGIGGSYYDAQTHLLDQESISRLPEHHLQLASALYIQPCDASHWLICNPTEAGNIAVIDQEALAFLGNFRLPMTVQEIVATVDLPTARLLPVVLAFLTLGFLCDLDQAHVSYSEQSKGSTLSAWLHITNACNLRCHYCYISKSAEHMGQETSRRTVEAVIRSAVRHDYNSVHLKYAGGEAALQMPQVIATHDYAQKLAQEHHLRLSASLLSNGTIITQRMIEQLKERHIHVMISLDGIGAVHDRQRPYLDGRSGSFAMVDRTISRLLANDLRPSIAEMTFVRPIAPSIKHFTQKPFV